MRLSRVVLSLASAIALGSCSDSNAAIAFDGQCDTTYDFLPPQGGDPEFRSRIEINGVCDLGPLGVFDVQTFQVIDDLGNDTATLSGSTIYADDFGNELFSDFSGTSSNTATGVTFGGTETYDGGIGDFENATGSADISGIGTLSGQTLTYLVQGEVEPN